MKRALTLIAGAGLIAAAFSHDDFDANFSASSEREANFHKEIDVEANKNFSASDAETKSAQSHKDLATSHSNSKDYSRDFKDRESHEGKFRNKKARRGGHNENNSHYNLANHQEKEGEVNVNEGLDHEGRHKTVEETNEVVELAEHVQSEKDLNNNEKINRNKWVKRRHNKKAFNENSGCKKAGKVVKRRDRNNDKVNHQRQTGHKQRGGAEEEEGSFARVDRRRVATELDEEVNHNRNFNKSNDRSFLRNENNSVAAQKSVHVDKQVDVKDRVARDVDVKVVRRD